jgi:hypothetical protein
MTGSDLLKQRRSERNGHCIHSHTQSALSWLCKTTFRLLLAGEAIEKGENERGKAEKRTEQGRREKVQNGRRLARRGIVRRQRVKRNAGGAERKGVDRPSPGW